MPPGPPVYEVTLAHRGGQPIAQLPFSTLQWGRVLDDVSSAAVTVTIASPDDPLAWVVDHDLAWQYELEVRRRGDIVWVGPVMEPEWSDDGITIPARDLMQWFERRTLDIDRSYTDTDLADIFQAYADDAMAGDPVPGLSITTTATGILGDRTVKGTDHRVSADRIRELARDGLDFTVIGRDIITGGIEVPTGDLQKANNSWLQKVKLKEAGLLRATKTFVIGSSPAGTSTAIAGVAGGTHSVDPPIRIDRVFSETDLHTPRDVTAAAQSRWDELSTSPWFVTGELDIRRGPDISDLVPGAICATDLRAGCRYITGNMRLASVTARVDAGDQGVTETIGLEFMPLGTASE